MQKMSICKNKNTNLNRIQQLNNKIMDSNYFKIFRVRNKILQLVLDSKTSINKTFRIMVKIEMEVVNNKKFIMKIN